MRAGSVAWWGSKVRQVRLHLGARIPPGERAAVAELLSPAQADLFDRMHPADRRHGLNVAHTLRADGVGEPDVLAAALLHDAGKGDTGLVPRVVHSLGQAYGPGVGRIARRFPGMAAALDRLARHAELSAGLAAAAGCSERTVELIRWQEAPRDPEFGELLRLADEAN